MTIQELIDELNKIGDKSMKVFLDDSRNGLEEFDGKVTIIKARDWSVKPAPMIDVILLNNN